MKKIALLAAAFIFGFAAMAQTSTKQPATSATKTRTLTTKQKPEAASKTVEATPAKMETKVTAPATTTTAVDVAQTNPAQASTVSPDAVIKINTSKHDFGKIPQGKPVTYSFEIKNISDKPVVVENTYASCGCTTPDRIVEPIAPGATVPLRVQYSAAGVGAFTKQVHIKLAGIAQEKLLDITGEVMAPEPAKDASKPAGN